MSLPNRPSLSAFLSVGFRPFFLLGSLFAALAMALWAAFWAGLPVSFVIDPVGGVLYWHAHEFIMGFALAIVFGFLLTAVQNWTGSKTTTPATLALLACSWILARCVMLFGQPLASSLILSVAIFPALATALMIALPIIRKRLWRNLFAPIALVLLALIDSALLINVNGDAALTQRLFMMAVLLMCLLITMIGGRVIPMFTANKLGINKATEPKPVFLCAVLPLPLLLFMQPFMHWTAVVLISSGLYFLLFISHAIRLKLWFNKGIADQPMLWSLWLFYACMPVGFLFLGLKPLLPNTPLGVGSIALHIITVGSISGLIASMLSRVSLGHSGRFISHDKWIVLAFVLLVVSVMIRTFLLGVTGYSAQLISYSAVAFSLAFALLFVRFLWVWISPRADAS